MRGLSGSLSDSDLIVVANREPYIHERLDSGRIVASRPPSGLVTAIEPLLRRFGGTWIAAATGSADRESADRDGRLRIATEDSEYLLQRQWFDAEVYDRYYSGFANEGLWPLCHTAHTRPSFRPADWSAYRHVNEAFARAAADAIRATSVVLVQDYHFALVPRLIRSQAPHAAMNLFWHIPWPNAEVFGICPWKEALLDGILGADVAGFHTRQHCLNFIDSAQRYLECRVDLEEMSISYGGRKTLVRPYPISVEWPYPAASRSEGKSLRESLGIAEDVHVSVGVDRADYTKGLIERIEAIELLLEQNADLAGRYVHVQLASPTRSHIRKYRDLATELQETVERVNRRFATVWWTPVVLQMSTYSPEDVRRHYAMADSAIVTPLHDGMNLVAKEYVASCSDGDGVLVLSVFAGAAKELDGALVVNPYDTQRTAHAILRAVRMPAQERRARMHSMRDQIAAHSIHHWADNILADLRTLRRKTSRFTPARRPARPDSAWLDDTLASASVAKEVAL